MFSQSIVIMLRHNEVMELTEKLNYTKHEVSKSSFFF